MKPWIKILIGIISTFFIILFVGLVIAYLMLKSTLPEYTGSINSSMVKEEIKIYRDNYAIPYVYAKSDDDLYFALGYLHAQERLFQMDLTRRAGEGRLSEILGEKAIPFDKMFRTIGINKIVKYNYSKYDSLTKQILISYSNGVNEFIKNNSNKFTIEFDVLGYDPYLWKPEHSLIIAKLMAWELNISWWSDIAFAHLIQKLGIEKVKEIMPDYDENAPTIIPSNYKNVAEIPLDLIHIDRDFRKLMGMVGTHIGSNNWVVNGARSNSGKPIIANDPHLGFTSPGKWYVAVLNNGQNQVEGFSLPGVPGIVIGKNKNIAWVLTNVMADDADFYIEKLDDSKRNYLIDGKWQSLETFEDTIKVKNSSEVTFNIRKTHRGPIISDIHAYKTLFPDSVQNSVDLSMRWSALDFTNELLTFYKINNAKNWDEFNNGLIHFVAPGQNFVYADVQGNIGYVAGVKLPLRKSEGFSYVYDGTNSQNDWEGFVPFEKNPRLYNPPQGYIASANNKTIKNYPFHISNIWEPSSRIERITEFLNLKSFHSVEDFKKYQNDFFSHYAKSIVPFIIRAFENIKVDEENVKTSVNLLDKWDFVFDAKSQTPAIYSVFFQFLLKNIFEDEMGENLFNEYVFIANVPYKTIPKLLKENNSLWFDNILTEVTEDRDQIIRKSLLDAVKYLETEVNANISFWQWGKIHKVIFPHFFHGQLGIFDKLLDVGPFDIGGDGTTVFNTEYSFTKPYQNKLGPSMRFIFNFAEPNSFEFILPTGQSGNFMSDHYKDMSQMWLEGKYLKIYSDEQSVINSKYNLLVINPLR